MAQIFKLCISIFFFITIFSCNKKSDIPSNKLEENKFNKSKIILCKFPDTIKLNKVVDGSIQYDVSNIGFNPNLIDNRFLELILSTSINKDLANYKEIDNNRLLSFTDSLSTGKFIFKAVFEKKGKQILNIAIRDYMYLKPTKATPVDKITLRTSDCLFSKQVFVVK